MFISHGAPTVALENDRFTRAMRDHGRRAPRPAAIAIVSAHWQARPPVRVNVAARPGVIHDFGGFPDALYALGYPAPGAPDVAAQALALLESAGIASRAERERGWDHGVWIPLRLVYPEADIPVVQISLPAGAPPAQLLALGVALRPLRERGVLLLGSGGIVHNLARLRFGAKDAPVDPWAAAFDEWVAARIRERDLDALARYRELAPHAELAVPTTDHFDPLFFVLGTLAAGDRLAPIHEGIEYGNLSMRSYAIEPG